MNPPGAFAKAPARLRRRPPPHAAAASPAEEESDPDLLCLERWRAGDAAAFTELVKRHEGRVFALLLRMLGSRAEAEDAAQDTFLNLHRHGRRFRREARFSTFVYRVATNAAINRLRGRRRRNAHLEKLKREAEAESTDALPQQTPGPEQLAAAAEMQRRVQHELLQLPEALRAPVLLHDFQGLDYAEIAQVLGCAVGTVKSRMHRARAALRARLADLVADGEGAL